MSENKWLVDRFEAQRSRLQAVAYRMLGSTSEADDAVQEAWLRLSRTDVNDVENLGGWLTTVVSRVCLDMLRSRKSLREETIDPQVPEANLSTVEARNAETEAVLADTVGLALLVVLETLAPAERVAFVLHDMFDLPFEEIASIVGRSSIAVRQLASRARRRVQGNATSASESDLARQRNVVEAFLAASRGGDIQALLALLDPNVVLRADHAIVAASMAHKAQGAPNLAPEIRGPQAVVSTFAGRARGAQLALIEGTLGAVWAPNGQPRGLFAFTIANDKIVEIEVIGDAEEIRLLNVTILKGVAG